MATYEGAVMGLLDAMQTIDASSSGVDPTAPLTLIGGGAKGATWQQVARRLTGRAVRVPAAGELVAIGAAAQAAAALRGVTPESVAAGWHTDAGVLLEPMARDDDVIARHRAVRALALEAVQSHPVNR
jgi:xylulokinase